MSPLTRRCEPGTCTVLSIVGVLLVVVVIVGAGVYLGPGRTDTSGQGSSSTASSTATASALASASASVSVLATLSVEEQALRDAALSMPKPERPAGMDEQTPEGAAAAATYFLSLYSYVYATGDLSLWQAMSTSDCEFCRLVTERVNTLHESGGWGEPWTDEVVAQSWGYDTSGEIRAITVAVDSPERTIHHGSDVQVWKAEQAHVQMQIEAPWVSFRG